MYTDRMNSLLDYIESHLDSMISYEEMAKSMAMSVYELRRIFAFIIGTPISDYIRKRRISESVFDLRKGETVTSVATKYGYDSPSSFSRAFRDMQGIAPSEAKNDNAKLILYPKARLDFSVSGADDIRFALEKRPTMKLVGMSGISDASSPDCGEDVWNRYYDLGYHDRLLDLGLFSHENAEFAAYKSNGDKVECFIGALIDPSVPVPDGMDELILQPALFGVFEETGTLDDQISRAYYRIVSEWLEASPYERAPDIRNLEAFPIAERKESSDMKWKIYYPLKEK